MIVLFVLFFFFFKQKTAYELRISDWSSDVCSSDLVCKRLSVAVGNCQSDCGIAEAAEQPRQAGPPFGGCAPSSLDAFELHDVLDAPVEEGGGIGEGFRFVVQPDRSEEHTSELQSLMRISYAVFCLKKKKIQYTHTQKHS